nr:retrovirus-related Pol polyprotein from transposon TNT 1-94 [Tanacetum cinerariifolium]
MLLAKKTSNEQVLLAEDLAWMESSSDFDQEINVNRVFMAQIKKVLSDLDKSSSSTEETIAEEQNNEFNEQIKVLNEKNADLLAQTEVLQDQLKVKHVVIDTHTECQAQYAKLKEERYEYMIRYSALCDNDKQHRKKIDEQEILFDKMSHLSSVSHSKLNKDVKRYSRKDLLSCNNSHLRETSIAYVCNDAMNVSCNSRLCDSFDENNLFIFDDESIVQICLWIIDSGCSKHMMDNRALLTNFVEKFLGTVRFGNNNFAGIASYGYVVIGSMTIKNVYYVEGLGHNLLALDNFVTRASKTPQQNDVVERRNRTLVEAARTMLTLVNLPLFLWAEALATACCIQNRSIIHRRFDKTPYELMNKRKPNIKFFRVFGCRCYLLNDYKDVGKLILECLLVIQKNMLLLEFTTNELIMKSSTTNVETFNVEVPSNEEEFFHESSESFKEESSSSSLNDNVQQSSEEVRIPSSNTQSISNNMIPNVDEASISYNVFNERLEDAYFDANTSFHDPSNVHTFYQPYPHEKK